MIRAPGAVLAAAALALAAARSALPAAAAAPPVHHAAEVRLDPESRRLTVVDVVTVRGRRAVRFRRAPWLAVERVLLDGRPVPAPGEAWRTALPDDGPHRVELRMAGTLPPLRRGRRGAMGAGAGLGPDGGYLSDGAGWLPLTGDDRVSYRLRVEVPAAFRAVASGRLGDEEVAAAAYRATFTADYPADPPALFVGPYEVREHHADGIRVRTYFHAELAGLADAYLRDSARYLVRYQARIGPYPYRDFHVVSAPVPVGLGFPNLTYIGRRVLRLPFIRARSLAHEVLHSWWGNGVAVDYPGGNWAEGLTTYMADHALAAEADPALGREMRLAWLRDYAALPADRDAPVTRFVAKHDDAAQVVGYNKVAFIFHMLRREVGAAGFDAALRRFWRHHRFRVAGWADLRRAFEAASGRDLGWFFAQWLDRAGAPRLRLGAVAVAPPTAEGAHRLRVTVRQERPAYRLTIPAVVETAAGLRRHRFVLEGAEATATLALDAPPLALRLDPEHDVFRRLLPGETPPILRDVTLAADALTVVAARDPATARAARRLAERLLDTPVRPAPAGAPPPPAAPLLIVGAAPEVAAYLARAGLAGVPESLAGRGTARVWTARRRDGRPLLAVAADGAAALEALVRPLPHYGRKSYLVFDGRRAVETGVWRVAESPLTRRLDRPPDPRP